MAAKVGNLVVEMSANVARLQRDFQKATSQAQRVAGRFKSIFKGVGLSMAAGLSVAGVTNLVRESLNAADKIAKLSQSVGVSVEQLSSYSHAAELAGTSLDSVARGLGLLSKNMMDTAADTGEARYAFSALGIEVKKADGTLRNSDDVLAEIADKFRGMQDGAGKTALAMRIFGRSGADLVPLLNQGSQGLAEMRQEAESLGLVFDTKTAQAAERINDNFTRMRGITTGLIHNLTEGMLPTLESLTNMMAQARANTEGMSLAAKVLSSGLKLLASAAMVVAKAFKVVGSNLGAVFAALYEAMHGNFKIAGNILKEAFTDTVEDLKDIAEKLKTVWDDTASDAVSKAPAIATKIAAPILETNKVIKKAAKETKEALRSYSDPLAAMAAEIYQNTRTPFEKFKEQVANLDLLRDVGLTDPETYRRAFNQLGETYAATVDKMKDKTTEMSEFTKQAFRSMQGFAESFFLDAMKGQFDDLGNSFKNMIDGMVANWLSVQLMTKMFGSEFGSGGDLGGWIGGLAGSFGGGKAIGGPVLAGNAYLVGEHGPELFMPPTSGNIVANGNLKGGSTVNMTVVANDANSFQSPKSQSQIQAAMSKALFRANRRNN